MPLVLVIYATLLSLAAVFVTVRDKNAARRRKRRIPEKRLMLIGLLGGSTAMLITMLVIRHKTNHLRFMLGLPLMAVVQWAVVLWYAATIQ